MNVFRFNSLEDLTELLGDSENVKVRTYPEYSEFYRPSIIHSGEEAAEEMEIQMRNYDFTVKGSQVIFDEAFGSIYEFQLDYENEDTHGSLRIRGLLPETELEL